MRGKYIFVEYIIYGIKKNEIFFSGHRQLTGYTRSMLLYSEDNARWEIWDNFNYTLQATLNSTAPMPIGVNSWQFVEAEECRNEKSLYRKVIFS